MAGVLETHLFVVRVEDALESLLGFHSSPPGGRELVHLGERPRDATHHPAAPCRGSRSRCVVHLWIVACGHHAAGAGQGAAPWAWAAAITSCITMLATWA